jgi:hypothetical protein
MGLSQIALGCNHLKALLRVSSSAQHTHNQVNDDKKMLPLETHVHASNTGTCAVSQATHTMHHMSTEVKSDAISNVQSPNSSGPLYTLIEPQSYQPTYAFVLPSRKRANMVLMTRTLEALYVGPTNSQDPR